MSSALGGILGGPRILQAVAQDKILPRLLSVGHGKNNEPRNALIFTFILAEYAGDLIRSLSVEQRMTICNMTIEGGARAGLIAPDEKIFNYLKGKPMSPKGDNWDKALNYWNTLKTDTDAGFDQELNLNANEILPMITWGTSPQDVITIDGKVPNPQSESDEDKKNSVERALKYMGLKPNMAAKDIKIDKVFIGSCTNGRIEDLLVQLALLLNQSLEQPLHLHVRIFFCLLKF